MLMVLTIITTTRIIAMRIVNICIEYTHVHIYIYMCIYTYICIYIDLEGPTSQSHPCVMTGSHSGPGKTEPDLASRAWGSQVPFEGLLFRGYGATLPLCLAVMAASIKWGLPLKGLGLL